MSAAPLQVAGALLGTAVFRWNQPVAAAVLISDLHVPSDGGAAFAHLQDAVAAARQAQRPLFVLGDLFDSYVSAAQVRTGIWRDTAALFGAAVAGGSPVVILHGNRDFLLDAHFERATGARIHPRGLLSRLPGGSACLWIHGDELCTLDHAYQRLRRVIRSGPVRGLSRTLPLGVGRGIARRLRSASVQAVAAKLPDEKSIQLDAARRWAREAAVPRLVCGHAHEYRRVELGDGAELIVLDAFGGPRDVLVVGAAGELEAHGSASWVTG
ncbi:MAG: metallophosphoesterase [Planctomycetes bacterium]|nr:metallophosphoesterase [Planctomycetota bacterium]